MPPTIRLATGADVPALLAIEHASFQSDRISHRCMRHLLTRANAATVLTELDGDVRGYLMLLFRSNGAIARIYSIATHPLHRGGGIAAGLVQAAERLAKNRICSTMRLEIRQDNSASLSLFQQHGYRIFGRYAAYYEDGMHASRLEKSLLQAENASARQHPASQLVIPGRFNSTH